MPKNIYLPKTEEIRMIESDFDKSRQVRYLEQNLVGTETEQRIADSYDLEFDSYGGIGSPKVYGPMYRASTERSTNERFTPFKTPCLEVGCSDTTIINWCHSSCGGNFQVSNRGHLKCNGCSLVGDIKEFRFPCSSHNRNYQSVNDQLDISALKRALFSALSEGAMDESITLELIQHLNNNG